MNKMNKYRTIAEIYKAAYRMEKIDESYYYYYTGYLRALFDVEIISEDDYQELLDIFYKKK